MLPQTTVFINALPTNAESAIALAVLLRHRHTDEEKLVDLLVENDRLSTVIKAIRKHLPAVWAIEESWLIESEQPVYLPMAA